jgi:hypothetical protein
MAVFGRWSKLHLGCGFGVVSEIVVAQHSTRPAPQLNINVMVYDWFLPFSVAQAILPIAWSIRGIVASKTTPSQR